MTNSTKKIISIIPLIALIAGILIRLLYANYFGSEVYQNYYTHDTPNHIQYIQFIAENLSLPKVDKGLEYPQQPFYYITAGISYRLLNYFLIASDAILQILVWFSAIFSIGTLFFSYLLAKKITNSIWAQSFVVGLLAFTPAFVYQSGMTGNDPLLAFFSAGAFFFLVCFIKEEKIRDIIFAIVLATLAVFTKITGGIVLIMILAALIYKNYYKSERRKILILVFAVSLIGLLCLATSFYRAYLPDVKKFHFVESYAYDGQQTNPTDPSYFLSFNLKELLKEGQSYVYGNKNVARTFPTFLYGSFLFGEYSYAEITNLWPVMKILMQFIILFGLIFPFGIIINLIFIKKWSIIDYISTFGAIINLVLIIIFLLRYPSVCNSDFRYFAPMFSGLLILSATGLYRFAEKLGKLKFIVPVLCFSLISFEFLWIASRLAIKIFANI